MSKIIRDDVDTFFEHDVHLPTRTIYMGSVGEDENGTDFQMAERVVKALHMLDQGDGDITIIMNNPGGDEYHGMAIYDAIKERKNFVRIKVYGHAMSMGSIILQAADKRIMSPNSRMMIHYGTWGIEDHPYNAYRWADEGKKFDKWMEDLYLEHIKEKHPRYTRKKLQDQMKFDWFITAQEAVDLGLADEVSE